MWAYVATYEMPNDDPEALERRVKVAYPVRVDKTIGLGTTPTLRLQRALAHARAASRTWEKLLVWSHWLWFLFPHGTVAYLLLRRPEHFPRGAAQIYATFDLGLIGYWAVPTAPPWYAARAGSDGGRPHARAAPDDGRVRRAVLEVRLGASVRFPRRQSPRCHAVAALRHLRDGRARAHRQPRAPPRRSAWTYAATLGLALVYLGEHYVVDLAAGLALAEGVRRGTPAAAPLARGVSGAVRLLERRARGVSGMTGPPAARAGESEELLRDATRGARDRGGRGRGPRPGDQPPQRAHARRCSCCSRSPRCTSCCRSSPASTTPGSGSRTAARTG